MLGFWTTRGSLWRLPTALSRSKPALQEQIYSWQVQLKLCLGMHWLSMLLHGMPTAVERT